MNICEKLKKNQEILEVELVKQDNDNHVFVAEHEEMEEMELYIPYPLFDTDKEKIKQFGDQQLGLITYVKIEEIQGNVVILNRLSALEELEKKFLETVKVGDRIVARYQNKIYKKDAEGKTKTVGIYVDYQGIRGFLPQSYFPQNLEQLYLAPNQKIRGMIQSIRSEKKEFILSTLELVEQLEIKKTYLGKLVKISEKNHQFNCNDTMVYVANGQILGRIKIGQKARIYVLENKQYSNRNVFFGLLSS